VVQAESEADVLRLCEEEQIELVITDVVMPNFSGPELWQLLRRLRPEIKVLFMSGYTDEVMLNHGIADGNVPFIQKPFSPEDLGRKVRELLGDPPAAYGAAGR
jgi:DNA-binding NtrC family response regulator